MPNHVDNYLTIICEEDMTLDKIRMMIFDKDESNNRSLKMLNHWEQLKKGWDAEK